MSIEKIQVITGVERRRRFTVEQKMRLVEESNRPGMSVSHVARIHGIAPSQLFHSRRRVAEGSREAVGADDEVLSAAEDRDLSVVRGVASLWHGLSATGGVWTVPNG